jgi:hypothetical protein
MPVWAPDSKRVAFNYILHEHRSDGWGTTVLFELRDTASLLAVSPLFPEVRASERSSTTSVVCRKYFLGSAGLYAPTSTPPQSLIRASS